MRRASSGLESPSSVRIFAPPANLVSTDQTVVVPEVPEAPQSAIPAATSGEAPSVVHVDDPPPG